jgi:putative membrane protein
MREKMKTLKFAGLIFVGLSIAVTASALAGQEGAKPSDAQIAAIVVSANTVDIDAGKVAKGKTQNSEVKQFADQMITDHTAVNKSAVDLLTKLKVTPAENDTSRSLKKGGDENLVNLKNLKGKVFDKAYIDHEVAYHQAVLDTIDNTLIPSAQNAELKALLEKVRPAIAAHLEHAKHIQASMK